MSNSTISDEQIHQAAERVGVPAMVVRRVILGLPAAVDAAAVIRELARAGVDREFLDRLHAAPSRTARDLESLRARGAR